MRLPGSLVLLALGPACASLPSAGPRLDATPVAAGAGAGAGADAGAPVDAGARQRALGLMAEVLELAQAEEEALWRAWTTGSPLDLQALEQPRAALLTPRALGLLAEGLALAPDEARRLGEAGRFVAQVLRRRELAAEEEAVASALSSTTFALGGRELRWAEVGRRLAAEPSALKRRELWRAARKVAPALDEVQARLEERRAALPAWPFEPELPAGAEEAARQVLQSTDGAWAVALAAQAARTVKVPPGALGRADLPRLLGVPAEVDAAFPREALVPRASALLAALSAGPRPLLDALPSPRKNPLPLVVAPRGPGDVRVSLAPVGGLKDQTVILQALGQALALASSDEGPARGLLTPSVSALATGALLARLVGDPLWLVEVGVPGAVHGAVASVAQAQELFAVRRAAAVVLIRAEGPHSFAAHFGRATGVGVEAEDAALWRVETADHRAAARRVLAWLEARRRAAELEAQGPRWWRRPLAPGPTTAASSAPTSWR